MTATASKLEKQYKALSDPDFSAMDCEDLAEEARQVYDQEWRRRFPEGQKKTRDRAEPGSLSPVRLYHRQEVRHDPQKGLLVLVLALLLAVLAGHPLVWGISLFITFSALRAFLIPAITLDHHRRQITCTLFFFYRKTIAYKTIGVNDKGLVQGESDTGKPYTLFPYACRKEDWLIFLKTIADINRLPAESRELTVKFDRDASQRLSAEICDLDSDDYSDLSREIIDRFGLQVKSFPVIGFDEVFVECTKGELRVGLEWDIWSGFIVVAKDEASESLVHEIGAFLKEKCKPTCGGDDRTK